MRTGPPPSRNRFQPPAVGHYDIPTRLKEAMSLHSRGQLSAAEALYAQILGRQPLHFDALHLLGLIATQAGRAEKGIELISRAIGINPRFSAAHSNLGMALRQAGRFDDALTSYDRAIKLDSKNAAYFYNRGNVLREMGSFRDALADYSRATSLNANYAEAHQSKSIALRLLGDLAGGWQHSQWRWKQPTLSSVPLKTGKPLWAPGRERERLLVWAEQGLGDEIMFGRFLTAARGMASQLLVKMDRRLIPLFARSTQQAEFFPSEDHVSEELYDCHLPMQDLASIRGPSLAAFRGLEAAYLRADSRRSTEMKLRLPANSLNCGITWKTKSTVNGPGRSIDLKQLVQALAMPKVNLVNLQYGDTGDDIASACANSDRQIMSMDGLDVMSDIDGLASLIQACDLVVSCDNATVHLAAALGKSTWVLIPKNPDWRWLTEGTESYWYPSVRLYRQQSLGRWDEALEMVGRDLRNLV